MQYNCIYILRTLENHERPSKTTKEKLRSEFFCCAYNVILTIGEPEIETPT